MRKLAKDCDRVARTTVKVVNSLRKDEHPTTGTTLTVRARRMLKADCGNLALLDPLCAPSADELLSDDGNGDGPQTALSDVWCHPQHSFLESNCP